MMDIKQLLDLLLPQLGQAGVDALKDLLEDLSADQDQPWKKAVLALLADAVKNHGPEGIEMARKAIEAILAHKVPKIDWANPRTASDIVAQLQNAEADQKVAARDFFVKLGEVLGKVSVGIVLGLIGA